MPQAACLHCAARRDLMKVEDLPPPVRHHVMQSLKCDGTSDICVNCIKGRAFPWGFPRMEKSAAIRRRAVCAVRNYSCDFDGRTALFPIPEMYEGVLVDKDKLAAAFEVPEYSSHKCICPNHRHAMTKLLKKDKTNSVLSPPAAKRPRTSGGSVETHCQHTICVNLRAALPNLDIADRHKVILACAGFREDRQSADVARCLDIDRMQVQRRTSLRRFWLFSGLSSYLSPF
jgi:hypothetical protein